MDESPKMPFSPKDQPATKGKITNAWREAMLSEQKIPRTLSDVMSDCLWVLGNVHLKPNQNTAPSPFAWAFYRWAMACPDPFFRLYVPRIMDYLEGVDSEQRRSNQLNDVAKNAQQKIDSLQSGDQQAKNPGELQLDRIFGDFPNT